MMAVILVWAILFHYLDNFFAIFDQLSKATGFKTGVDSICIKLSVKINITKKQLGYVIDFLGFKLDILEIEKCLL